MNGDIEKPTSRAGRFFGNPVFGIIGCIAGVIGVLLYMINIESRDLIYSIHPTKTAVVRAKQSSKISVQVDGTPVAKDVTAAQIVIWNNGKKPIRRENLLGSDHTIFVRTRPENPIIEAKILKLSREEIVGLHLDQSQIHIGQLGVEWDILEKNDGAMLQLIYFGDETTPITASATVEQQGDIRTLEHKETIVMPMYMAIILIAAGVLYIVFGVRSILRRHRTKELELDINGWFYALTPGIPIVAGAFMLGIALYALISIGTTPSPPFEF